MVNESTFEKLLHTTGLRYLLKLFSLASAPSKLFICLLAMLLSLAYGQCLDAIWMNAGHDGSSLVFPVRIDRFDPDYLLLMADKQRSESTAATSDSNREGIFQKWLDYERQCILGLFGSTIPVVSLAANTPLEEHMQSFSKAAPFTSLLRMAAGIFILIVTYPIFSIFMAVGLIAIWSIGGAMTCRMCALQFCADRNPTMAEAARYVWHRLYSLCLAPGIPLILMISMGVLIMLTGLLVRLPGIGGLFFFLPLILGFLLAIFLLASLTGISLVWPSICIDSVDAFDAAFGRSLGYILQRPWNAFFYAVQSLILASISWLLINLFTYLALRLTRSMLLLSGVILWKDKSLVERIWPMKGPYELYDLSTISELSGLEYISAWLIGIQLLLVIGLMWSFIASYYFCASSVVYTLLRRDVDGIPVDSIYLEKQQQSS